MKRKSLALIAIAGSLLLFVAAIAADLSGKWVGQLSTPDGNSLDVSYNFKVDGNKLTGSASSPAGDVSIDNGKVDGDKFSFTVNVNGQDYPHTGKVYADSCGMDVDFGGPKMHMKLTRAK